MDVSGVTGVRQHGHTALRCFVSCKQESWNRCLHLVSTISFDDRDDDNMGERHTAHTLQSPQHLDLDDNGVTTVKGGLFFRFVEYDGVTVDTSLCFLEGVRSTTESSIIDFSTSVFGTIILSSVGESVVGILEID